MNDLISRQAALEAIEKHKHNILDGGKWDKGIEYGYAAAHNHICDVISHMPTAKRVRTRERGRENTMRWIPVTKSLPKNDDWCIVTILDESGDTPFRYTDFGWYLEEASCWIVGAERWTGVVAWMPLPEPWRGEEEE